MRRPTLQTPIERHLRPALTDEGAERLRRSFALRRRSTLGAPVEGHLRPAVDASDTERMLRSMKLRRGTRARVARRRRVAAGAAAVVGALAAAAVLALRPPTPGDGPGSLRLASGAALPATLSGAEAPTRELSDGSRLELAPDARLAVRANDGGELAVRLDAGRAAFDVRPGGPRRWAVEAGATRVAVVGTRFTVERGPGATRVAVDHGVVVVSHPELAAPLRLGAGDAVTLADPGAGPAGAPHAPAAAPGGEDGRAAAAPGGDDEGGAAGARPEDGMAADTATPAADHDAAQAAARPDRASPAAGGVVVSPSPRGGGSLAPPPRARPETWRDRALRGDYRGAYRLLGPAGVAGTAAGVGPEDRLLLADVARNAGHLDEALPVLRALLEAGGAAAPVAGFTLGRLELDRRGRPATAAALFERVVRLAPSGPLAEDALGLAADAWDRAGETERARAAARGYLDRFPGGRRADAMRARAAGEAP